MKNSIKIVKYPPKYDLTIFDYHFEMTKFKNSNKQKMNISSTNFPLNFSLTTFRNDTLNRMSYRMHTQNDEKSLFIYTFSINQRIFS